MAEPLVPLLIRDLGGSPAILGVIMSVAAVGSLFTAIPVGVVVQRFGTRAPVLVSCACIAASYIALYWIPSLWFLFIGYSIAKTGEIAIIVAVQAHVANLGEGRNPDLDFGWYGSAAALGQMIGPFIAGLIIDHYGTRNTWVAIAAFLLVSAVAFRFLVSAGNTYKPTSSSKPSWKERVSGILSLLNAEAFVAILSSFIVLFAMGVRGAFFPLYMSDLGFSATLIGTMLSLRALVTIGTRAFMKFFIAKAGGRFQALIISLFVLAIGIGTIPLCSSIALLIANSVLIGFGIGMALPLSMATVAGSVPEEKRGIAMSIRLTGNRLAQLLNPLFFGAISQWAGLIAAFYAGGAFLFVSGLPILVWWQRKKRRMKNE